MVYLSSVSNKGMHFGSNWFFKTDEKSEEVSHKPAKLLYEEKKNHPIITAIKVNGSKLKNAFFTYPKKGFEGSKNSNFYEFLTMGVVPYITGGATMIGVTGLGAKYFDSKSAANACKMAKKMGVGVIGYGIAKKVSENFVEYPLNYKYGIDVNVPYLKKIDELPEERNKNNLVAFEYHTPYESVDFPYFDLFYDNKAFGLKRNSYFYNVGKKNGLSDEDLENSDQKVKPFIKEKVIQTKLFSSISSYLWAATAVGVAMQEPFDRINLGMIKKGKKGSGILSFAWDMTKRTYLSFKKFIGTDRNGIWSLIVKKCKNRPFPVATKPLPKHVAARVLFGSALGTTLLGNFVTLTDFNKYRGKIPIPSTSLINDSKEKVVC